MEDDEYSYESEKKGVLLPLITFIAIIVVILILFSNFKTETLNCSKSENLCYIDRVNLINLKSRKKLMKYSDIGNISYITQNVSGNVYAKGYTSYLLTIYTKKNNPVVVFSTEYFEYKDIADAVENLKRLMKSADDTFQYQR